MPAARPAHFVAACLTLALTSAWAQTSSLPITADQRRVAEQVASAGVPLSELAPNAPDSHTVKAGDTLWDISGLFLKSPWRWPELWGMNRDQIRNPHLIYPGQVLVLVKSDGRARLQFGQRVGGGPGDTVKLSPQMRISALDGNPIPTIPLHLIQPFLTDAVVFDTNVLATAPRIVAAQEGHVLMGRGDLAYARGDFAGATDFRIFRNARELRDPATKEILGYEAPYVGTADLIRAGEDRKSADGKTTEIVPATLQIKLARQEVGVGDRLAPAPQRNLDRYVPHAPDRAMAGQVVSIYGEALNAGQNQIVALNRGKRDGVERGHVFALWRDGERVTDKTGNRPEAIKLPDERHGVLFVFEVYERVSYALIISVKEPVKPGDRFTQP
ncbi:LysM domain-containing protein [Roseateles asaccharophilus]|uniref:LysM repeat protein n=1 Tax=Roseateles asaccharophilus TaxID=582607 RepID=A0ABU2A9B2_9BURK|nr:LysM domain-containing protein [Roseateles asaccharophilus]MDR7332613.1 LysM repeat protein [Roseateles asaccharophilus]